MTTEHAANVGVECRQGNHARCGLVCGCECHRLPRRSGWREGEVLGPAARAKPLHDIEVPAGLRLVEEAHQ